MLDEEWTKLLNGWGYAPVHVSKSSRPTRLYLPVDQSKHFETIVNADRVVKTVRPIIVAFADLLLGALKQDKHDVPWSVGTHSSWRRYDREMAAKFREFANNAASRQPVLKAKLVEEDKDIKGDELLTRYLKEWGDHGPLGYGVGGY